MNKRNRNEEALIDIYNAINDILSFTDGITKKDLEINRMRLNATLYSIQIIGEAIKRLSLELRKANPEIPWKKMAGMRDKIVHDYNRINLNLIWEVATQEIPKLQEQIKVLLP